VHVWHAWILLRKIPKESGGCVNEAFRKLWLQKQIVSLCFSMQKSTFHLIKTQNLSSAMYILILKEFPLFGTMSNFGMLQHIGPLTHYGWAHSTYTTCQAR
jgi:hypothetical protein